MRFAKLLLPAMVGLLISAPLPSFGEEYETVIMKWACNYNLDPALIKEVIRVESNFDTLARSPKGAVGLMQLMPETCRLYGVFNPYSPQENIRGGSAYLRDLIERYGGNLKLALAAYNSGVGNVDRYGTVPPYLETRKYVEKILTKYEKNQRTAPICRVKSPAGQVVLTNRPELYPDWRKEVLR